MEMCARQSVTAYSNYSYTRILSVGPTTHKRVSRFWHYSCMCIQVNMGLRSCIDVLDRWFPVSETCIECTILCFRMWSPGRRLTSSICKNLFMCSDLLNYNWGIGNKYTLKLFLFCYFFSCLLTFSLLMKSLFVFIFPWCVCACVNIYLTLLLSVNQDKIPRSSAVETENYCLN